MKQVRNVGIALVMIAAMVSGFWLSSSLTESNKEHSPESNHIQGNILPVARKIAIPELLKSDGTAFTNADVQGHWTLVFFGYTHCPDVCPTTLGTLAQAKKSFSDDPDLSGINFPNVIFVSVDPERDSVEVLNEYVKYFESTFIGVTGTPKLIEALTLQMSVVYMKVPGSLGSANDYAMDHSSSMLMLNPEGKLHAFLSGQHSVTSIVNSVRTIIDSY